MARAFPVQGEPGALRASLRAAGGRQVLRLPLPGQPPRRRAAEGGGPLPAAALRARAHAGLVRAVYAPVRAPHGSNPALAAAFAATVSSPVPPPPPPGRGLCPRGPRHSPRARRTSSRRMPGPVSTAAAAGRAGLERGRKMILG